MNRPDQKHALVTTNISKNFGGVQAVRSVNLVVPIGERRALIGPNGAGKSTLFNLIAGELTTDQGKIEVFGADVTKKSIQERARMGLGRTYQISQLFLNLTVEENLFLAGVTNTGIERSLFKRWIKYKKELDWAYQVAEEVRLTGYLKNRVSELSHGLQRQLEVGMAMAMRPKLVMLDEPAAGLSPSERHTLTLLIKSLPADITLIIIEHDMEIVLEIADRISVLHHGALIAEDTPEGIRANQEVQKIYLGGSVTDSRC
jgi:branched-chain amino acid transport system ATP-binding protein